MTLNTSQATEQFFSQYPQRTYPKGQILIHSGDEPRQIFYLTKGMVRQYDISDRGDEVVVNVFKPGAFFPMLWAMTKLPNRYFFGAETTIEVRVVPYQEVLDFLQSNPEVIYDLLTRLYIGVDGMLGRMAQLMAGSARSRLLYEILIDGLRFGEVRDDGSRLLDISGSQLAARTGLSRETVSRELQKIAQDNIIALEHQKIVINNVDELQEQLSATL